MLVVAFKIAQDYPVLFIVVYYSRILLMRQSDVFFK